MSPPCAVGAAGGHSQPRCPRRRLSLGSKQRPGHPLPAPSPSAHPDGGDAFRVGAGRAAAGAVAALTHSSERRHHGALPARIPEVHPGPHPTGEVLPMERAARPRGTSGRGQHPATPTCSSPWGGGCGRDATGASCCLGRAQSPLVQGGNVPPHLCAPLTSVPREHAAGSSSSCSLFACHQALVTGDFIVVPGNHLESSPVSEIPLVLYGKEQMKCWCFPAFALLNLKCRAELLSSDLFATA